MDEPTSHQLVRFALTANRPPLTEALTVGELARRSAMAQYGRRNGGRPSAFLSGHDTLGRHLAGNEHAHYLLTDEDEDGALDHLTVWTPAGLAPEEREAVLALERLVPSGQPAMYLRPLPDQPPPAALVGPARVWRSLTPFVPVRYPKPRSHRPEDQVVQQLALRGLDQALVRVEPAGDLIVGGRFIPWSGFRRVRPAHPPVLDVGLGFRLHFGEPVCGPITLGYGNHQGLGLFVAGE